MIKNPARKLQHYPAALPWAGSARSGEPPPISRAQADDLRALHLAAEGRKPAARRLLAESLRLQPRASPAAALACALLTELRTNSRLLLLACLLLAACQSHRRQEAGRAVATLNVLNQVAAVDIAHEKNGDPPPRGFATWPAYWHHHFGTLRFTPAARDRNNRGLSDVGDLNLAFVKQQRAAAGLPPFD